MHTRLYNLHALDVDFPQSLVGIEGVRWLRLQRLPLLGAQAARILPGAPRRST